MGAKFSSSSFPSLTPVSSSSSASPRPTPLLFTNHLTSTHMSLNLVADGKLLSPAELRAQIVRPLKIIKAEVRLFAQRSPRYKHRQQQALLPLGCIIAECSPCGRLRLMLPCVAFACQRLVTAPADTHMAHMSWSWAEMVMERVTRGRVKKVQVRLQRRACCAVRCVFDACCRKRWLLLRCVAAHRSGCIKRAAAFILVCRLLLPPALQADATFWTRHITETALR